MKPENGGGGQSINIIISSLTKTLTFLLSSICNLSVDRTSRITEDQKVADCPKPREWVKSINPQPMTNRPLILFLIGLPFRGAGIIFHIGSTCSIILHDILTQVPGIKFKDLSKIIFRSFEQNPILSLIVYCCKHCFADIEKFYCSPISLFILF